MQKIHTIIESILLLLFICIGTGYCIQTNRLASTRQELELCRTELTAARNRQQDAINTVDECYRNATRAGEILGESVNTVHELREQISEIRENYEAMENRLLQFYGDNNRASDSNNVSNQVGER